ncbi:MAG: magnesium chelatase family protein, partial [Candidatus Midichloriaceae bacterium]
MPVVSNVYTVSFVGLTAKQVEVQVHISEGLPAFSIVGMANKSVVESKERIRSAFSSVGLSLPPKRITVNLSPADLIKEGSHYDLPIAMGLLIEMEIIDQEEIDNYIVLGELSLSSNLYKVPGILPAAIWTNAHNKGMICPFDNGSEASWSGNDTILAPKNMIEIINHFKGKGEIAYTKTKDACFEEVQYPNLIDVK